MKIASRRKLFHRIFSKSFFFMKIAEKKSFWQREALEGDEGEKKQGQSVIA
jgi:hypothetical protein